MKNFKTILLFELKGYFKNKIFRGVTIFLVAAIIIVMFFPRAAEIVQKGDEPQRELPVMLVADGSEGNSYTDIFREAFPGYDVRKADGEEEIKSAVLSGKAECGFVIASATSYKYFVNNLSMYDTNSAAAEELMRKRYIVSYMEEHGISEKEASDIISANIFHETEKLGKDQAQNFFYTYIMIFALYTVILFYGQMVATNVATEKSSRAMELLITSAKPTSMMFGKVIASCLAGLTQLVCVFGAAMLSYNANKEYWSGNALVNSVFDMPANLILYMLLFFVLGFFMYAFMFGAVGSTASKLEDINTSVMPITMIFIAALMIVVFSMSSENIDNTLMKVCSYIPFTSPVAMFTRIAMSTVPVYETAISVGILIAAVVGIGVLSAKIYRVGVLLYGTAPKITDILKNVFRKQ